MFTKFKLSLHYLPVKFTVTESLKFPMRGVPLLPHMIACTAKVHKVIEFDKVKSEQFTDVLSVVFGQFPQLSDEIL